MRFFDRKDLVITCGSFSKTLALPQGGALLWVQLPGKVSGSDLYLKALDHHISILPGRACAIGEAFDFFIRIGCGHPFTERMETGIATLERLTEALMA